MFTGIVQGVGRVTELRRHAGGAELVIDRGGWRPTEGREPRPGDSIALSGVCLTVTEATDATLRFDAVAETLALTTIGSWSEGTRVNLEPAVTPAQPMGGHFVQGHVDGVGVVLAFDRGEADCRLTVRPPASLLDQVVHKGSIAIDGVSLTVASVEDDAFTVALIPTTLAWTTLGELNPDDRVNLETDVISKTIVHYLNRRAAGADQEPVTMQTLRDAGFLE